MSPTETPTEGGSADILVLIDESGVPRGDKKTLIRGFEDSIGMTLDERYGTLTFSGPLEVLERVSERVVDFINRYQMTGRIFPALRRETIDDEFKDRLLRYSVFQRFWEVNEERAVILTYDINHADGRSGRRYHTLQKAGALKIFQSCYWIPKEKVEFVSREFSDLVEESRRAAGEESRMRYHYRVLECYPVGSPEGLRRWKELQLTLFFDKIKSLYERTRGKWNWFAYISAAYAGLPRPESEAALKKAKRLRYWKGRVERELAPYRDAHLRRMRRMGVADKEVETELVVDGYGESGESREERRREALSVEDALGRLEDVTEGLHERVYEFVEEVESNRAPAPPTPVSSGDFGG
jgi:hypothetical protein